MPAGSVERDACSMRHAPRHRTLAIGACIACLVLCSSPALCQDAEPDPVAAAADPNCGGLRTGTTVVNTVRSLFGRKVPSLLSRVRAGNYCASSQAIGAERDIDNQRGIYPAGLIRLPKFTNYANALLERLKEATTLTDVPGAVHVVADPGFGAKSTADGNIYVSFGSLDVLESEAALVALLAHELAHVVLAHFESDVFTSIQKQFQTVAGLGAGLRRSLESYQRTGTAKSTLATRDQQQLQRLQLIIDVSDNVLHPAWNRRQELEADRFALDLTQRLGYSYASGLKAVLEHIEAAEDAQNAKAEARRAEAQQLAASDIGKQFSADLKQMFDQLSRKHDDAKARLSAIDTYFNQTYPDAPAARSQPTDFKAVVQSADVKRVLEGYRIAFRAEDLLEQGQPKQALNEAQRAAGARGAVSSHAFPLLVLSRALRRAGQAAPANAVLVRSTRAAEPAIAAHREYAEQLVREGKRAAAYSEMENTFERFRKAPILYVELIGFFSRHGRQDRAQQLLSECTLTLPSIREACARAAQGS